jgi:hypothetical protein
MTGRKWRFKMATVQIKMVDDNDLVKELIHNIHAELTWEAADYFAPCNTCGKLALYSAMIDTSCSACRNSRSRMEVAVNHAEVAFWAAIADMYPEIKTGDLEPMVAANLSQVMFDAATRWYNSNTPATRQYNSNTPATPGPFEGLSLHMSSEWELENTGGNVMVAYLMFYSFDGEARRIGVTSECICIINRPFEHDSIEDYTWFFGDNPTAFLNALEEYAVHSEKFDFGKIFDDCQTIAKSGLV